MSSLFCFFIHCKTTELLRGFWLVNCILYCTNKVSSILTLFAITRRVYVESREKKNLDHFIKKHVFFMNLFVATYNCLINATNSISYYMGLAAYTKPTWDVTRGLKKLVNHSPMAGDFWVKPFSRVILTSLKRFIASVNPHKIRFLA